MVTPIRYNPSLVVWTAILGVESFTKGEKCGTIFLSTIVLYQTSPLQYRT